MISRLLSRLREARDGATHAERQERLLPEVTAALLIEVARADFHADTDELMLVERLVAERFDLDATALDELLQAAHLRVAEAVSLYEFTREINAVLDEPEKLQILEMLWRVAHADGRIDEHEEHLVRRVADLLHLPHRDFIRTRLRVTGD